MTGPTKDASDAADLAGAGPRDLRRLPKAHLHVHLDGSYPRAAVERLAAARGRTFTAPARFDTVWEFYDAYTTVLELVTSHDELAGLCRALVAAEAAQGVVYLEPAVEPQLFVPRLGSLRQVLTTMLRAFAEASADHGIEVGAQVAVNTDNELDISEDVARLAAAHAGEGVTAFGTAGFIEPAGLARFRPAVSIARAAGLDLVCHAGETGGPDSVIEALDTLRPRRIAHGVLAASSPRLLTRLADEGIVCDVCPTSNIALGIFQNLSRHTLPVLLAHRVAVTLNADDELWFGSSVTGEYELARSAWGLTDSELAQIAANGAAATGMSDGTRTLLRAGAAAWLAET